MERLFMRLLFLYSGFASLIIGSMPVIAGGSPVNGTDQFDPIIANHSVFWIGGSQVRREGDIYMKDLTSGHVRRLTTVGTILGGLSASASTVVWEDCRRYNCAWVLSETSPPVTPTIFGADIQTANSFLISRSSVAQWQPQIAGHTVVWVQIDQKHHSRVYIKNLITGRQMVVSSQPGDQVVARISNTFVVWQQFGTAPGASSTIYAMNLRTSRQVIVARYNSLNDFPDDPVIDGNIVIWRRWYTSGPANSITIEGRDLVTGRAFVVAHIPPRSTNPQLGSQIAISGRLVFWDEARSTPYVIDDSIIYGKNIVSGRMFRLTLSSRIRSFPSIGEGYVAWEEHRSGHTMIVVRRLAQLMTP